jgi:sugar/nucleoside kinase (ribokinase family)
MRLDGRARQADVTRMRLTAKRGTGVVAAYTVNELPPSAREALLRHLVEAHSRGARVLVIEPIARRQAAWWDDWVAAFSMSGGRADEWRFIQSLPARQRNLARAAGLNPRELTARTLTL